MYRVDVRVEAGKTYVITIPAGSFPEGVRSATTVPVEAGYTAAAIDLIEEATGRRVVADEIEWNVVPEAAQSDAVSVLRDRLERRLAVDYPALGRAVEPSLAQVDDLLRRCPDRMPGYADVRALVLESMLSMLDFFGADAFDDEVVWSHFRVVDSLPGALATMPAGWRYRHLEDFAYMAYPYDYDARIGDLIAECAGWDETARIAELYEYIQLYFDARIDDLDEDVKELLRDSSAGPTNYPSTSYHDEYGWPAYIPYVLICHLRERGELRRFVTGAEGFEQVWRLLGATGDLMSLEVHDFVSSWRVSWTGGPIDHRAVPEGCFTEYADLPEVVHELWREVGFAGFDNALLWTCDPREWQPIVDEWLAGSGLPEHLRAGQIPLFRTAFGEIMCFHPRLGHAVRIDPFVPEVAYTGRAEDFGSLVRLLGTWVRGFGGWRDAFRRLVEAVGPLDHTTVYVFDPPPFAGDAPLGPRAVHHPDRARKADARSAMAAVRSAAPSGPAVTEKPYFGALSGR